MRNVDFTTFVKALGCYGSSSSRKGIRYVQLMKVLVLAVRVEWDFLVLNDGVNNSPQVMAAMVTSIIMHAPLILM